MTEPVFGVLVALASLWPIIAVSGILAATSIESFWYDGLMQKRIVAWLFWPISLVVWLVKGCLA
jgi:hypothetical protein